MTINDHIEEILIIGAGVFGLSSALALLQPKRRSFVSAHITIIDAATTLPNPSGSSVDSSRIIRADYASPPYARLAGEAQKLWRDTSDDGWGGQGRYHEPGFILTANAGSEGYLKKSLENVRVLGDDGTGDYGTDPSKIQELSSPEAIRKASGYSGVSGEFGYVNWNSGWADAEATVRYALHRLEKEGKDSVTVRSGCKVRRLLFEEGAITHHSGLKCSGVELDNGELIHSDLTIVAAGAWTPTLINLQRRVMATGQVMAYVDLTEEEMLSMRSRPTIMNMSNGMFIIPPTGRELKVARHGYGYQNAKTVPSSEQFSREEADNSRQLENVDREVSVPEVGISIPQEAKDACTNFLRIVAPELADRGFSRTRVCWYSDTPVGDFLIDRHPSCKNLCLATGGSGHGFKFFPVIGDKIVDMIEGSLDEALVTLWSWPKTGSLDLLGDFVGTDDGSRSGRKGMQLDEELKR